MNKKIYNQPKFNRTNQYLLSGIHLISIADLYNHPILAGNVKRLKLIDSLKEACEFYWSYGIDEIFVDGSFASIKENPGDIDGYITVESETDPKYLKILNSGSIWGDYKTIDPKTGKFLMWSKHRIEFYVHPIHKAFGMMYFPDFFTSPSKYLDKGILKIIK
ncbi:MAG TPA: hypothetical protein P5556_02325 [Candidatus Gastranaerophilales bacterium]|nr:hypothetical protein [Candidatus Gastranaerophilales bacterium]